MPDQHKWKTVTPEGERREVRATRSGGSWQIQSRLKGEERWVRHERADVEDLEALLDVLSRKYRRNRVPYEHVCEVEKLISDRGR